MIQVSLNFENALFTRIVAALERNDLRPGGLTDTQFVKRQIRGFLKSKVKGAEIDAVSRTTVNQIDGDFGVDE